MQSEHCIPNQAVCFLLSVNQQLEFKNSCKEQDRFLSNQEAKVSQNDEHNSIIELPSREDKEGDLASFKNTYYNYEQSKRGINRNVLQNSSLCSGEEHHNCVGEEERSAQVCKWECMYGQWKQA